MENFVFHPADSRGSADHGWLKAKHSFSFASYYDPQRMHFGVLRVLNDDAVSGGAGFGKHPHDNMEIITIPLEGRLAHKDSMGNEEVITAGEIQVMSAGTGIYHSEYNKDPHQTVKLLQIWVYPNKRDVEPRYGQARIDISVKDKLHQIVSPNAGDEGLWIHQDAWFSMGEFNGGAETSYNVHKPGNGVYAFIISGKVNVNGHQLSDRDGLGLWDIDTVSVKSETESKLLLMEVPMR